MRLTLLSSANFLARGLAKMRSSDEAVLGLETFGSGELTGFSTASCLGGAGAEGSLVSASPASDAEGL